MPDQIQGSEIGSGLLLGVTDFLSNLTKQRQQNEADASKIKMYQEQQDAQYNREQRLQDMRMQAEKEVAQTKILADQAFKMKQSENEAPGLAILDPETKQLQVIRQPGVRGKMEIHNAPGNPASSTETVDTQKIQQNNQLLYGDLQAGMIPVYNEKGKLTSSTPITSYQQALDHVITSGGDPTNPAIAKLIDSYKPENLLTGQKKFLGFLGAGTTERKNPATLAPEDIASITSPVKKTSRKVTNKTMLGSSGEPAGYQIVMPGKTPNPQSTGSQAYENSQIPVTAQIQAPKPKAKSLDDIF
jgi:hypothetical protein